MFVITRRLCYHISMSNDKKKTQAEGCAPSDCASCGESCPSRKQEPEKAKLNALSSVKHVIAVMSGKGGVGKTLVTTMLAAAAQKSGYSAAVLDADITGPSVPKAFGIKEKATGSDLGLFPVQSKSGVQIMSLNLLVKDDTDPVVWRGPMIAGAMQQFWTDVIWKDVDYMFVDMPPGTGDIPLTVFGELPVDGIVLVTSPQELVGMIVEKAAKMANMMNVPIIGLVENMSYFVCPNCDEKHHIFGESKAGALAAKYGIKNVVQLPLDINTAREVDSGNVENVSGQMSDFFKLIKD